MDHCSVFSTQGKERQTVEVTASRSNHIAKAGSHSNATGNRRIRRKRRHRDTSDSSNSEESFKTEDDQNSVKRNLDTSTQDFNRDLDSSTQGWQLLDTCEPSNDEEVVKGRLKFFFMNLADKFHITRTVPYDLCLQVKLQSVVLATKAISKK